MKLFIILIVLTPFLIAFAQTDLTPKMPAIFSDNMVLQQKSEVPVWGMGTPGSDVIISTGWGVSTRSKILTDGTWKVQLKTKEAGGPFQITIRIGDSTIVYKNVMLGEVWLCSGQSNMEMPLEGWPPENNILNSTEEIKDAVYPEIRLFTVARAFSAQFEFNCSGQWTECSPKTAAKFSATAYFFGLNLHKELKVPIGLIVSSWGGTRIQSWISGAFLGEMDKYKPIIGKMDIVGNEVKKLNSWIQGHKVVDISSKSPEQAWENLEFGDSLCSNPDFDDVGWNLMTLPCVWESTQVGNFDGVVWFRKKIEIPKSWTSEDLVVELGPIDDMDRAYVNGVMIGKNEKAGLWQIPRIYTVPRALLNDSVITIAVRVIDNGGGGGIWGNGSKMQIHPKGNRESISLTGNWKFLPVAEYNNMKFYVFDIQSNEYYSRPKTSIDAGPNTPTMLYNAMIAPIIPFSIKGVIWYQGETNSDMPDDYNSYKTLLPLLIKNWRSDWDEGDFPFYYAQIAPFMYGEKSRSQIIREAQLKSLSVPKTGMAVLLDIGNATNIHPSDKEDVGSRLALWALAKDYHKKLPCSGPLYKSMKVQKNKIIVSFDYVGKGLVLLKKTSNSNFMIAGEDRNFVKAEIKVVGNKLIFSSNNVQKPVAVRYGWSNFVDGNLYNTEGFPASSFRTDNWED